MTQLMAGDSAGDPISHKHVPEWAGAGPKSQAGGRDGDAARSSAPWFPRLGLDVYFSLFTAFAAGAFAPVGSASETSACVRVLGPCC